MGKIGIVFGTNSGTTRLIAKKLARLLGGECVDAPLNVNRISVHNFVQYDALILGTPSFGEGELPSELHGTKNGSWHEFLMQLEDLDMATKTIGLYGLGD